MAGGGDQLCSYGARSELGAAPYVHRQRYLPN